MKRSAKLILIVAGIYCTQLLTACDAYVQFEMFRLRWLLVLFVVTLIIGIVGMAFRK